MCGLTGCWMKKADASLHASVEKMSQMLNHRGPDAVAVWVDEREDIGLGHRRLKVIDLSENGAKSYLKLLHIVMKKKGAKKLPRKC